MVASTSFGLKTMTLKEQLGRPFLSERVHPHGYPLNAHSSHLFYELNLQNKFSNL